MSFRIHTLALAAACGLLSTSWMCYSASDFQLFRVNVPARLSITPPSINPIRTHNGLGNADVSFPRQGWTVKTNSPVGASVILETGTCFQHTTDTTSKRDGRLALRVNTQNGPGLWAVTRATDTTDYATGDETAMVQAFSDNMGEAELGLTVTFITGIGHDLSDGDYSLTVIGTITAN